MVEPQRSKPKQPTIKVEAPKIITQATTNESLAISDFDSTWFAAEGCFAFEQIDTLEGRRLTKIHMRPDILA